MSYLSFPRLHFSGRFQADPSTVNNNPAHYNNQTFTPSDQLLGEGWWNPEGTGYWRIRDCFVRSICYRDGKFCDDSSVDSVIGMELNGATAQVSGKLIDLDPDQRMVSEIWGLELHLGNIGKPNAFCGQYDVAPFSDMWRRIPQGTSQPTLSVVYQSVISSIQWSETINSPFVEELMVDGVLPTHLSIKFVLDGYDDDRNSPEFTWGRIVGVIGPYTAEEPKHFVADRLLRTVDNTPLNYAPCRIDLDQKCLLVDLGNSIPTTAPGGQMRDLGDLQLALLPKGGEPSLIGTIDYLSHGWYENRAGIKTFKLTEDQLALAKNSPLAVVKILDGTQQVYLSENQAGAFARADDYVFRLNPGDRCQTMLYATKFGIPCANQQFDLNFDNSVATNKPKSALDFPNSVTTDVHGKAVIELRGGQPGNPRRYIDGQVYSVRYDWHGIDEEDYNGPQSSAFSFPAYALNVLVWDDYQYEHPPTWVDNVQPIFQQYANLYPVMKNIVDLGDYSSVVNHLQPLKLVFSLPVSNPNYMPVSRDLSGAKRKMLQEWLNNPVHMQIVDVDRLKRALQLAIELEHVTIPPYLCALYSIKPGQNQEVAEIIQSVVIEEMLHMALACNLLNAIGGSPKINAPGFVPRYPSKLPAGLRPELTVSLRKCSIDQIRDVFMSIEEPEETTQPEERHRLTIGEFYHQISQAFENLSQEQEIFVGDPDRQLQEWHNTREMIPVLDLASAKKAIDEIIRQGEGTSPINPEDGDAELAHFYKFAEIVHGQRMVLSEDGYSFTGDVIPFDPDGVWPVMDNPSTDALPEGSQVRLLSEEFNRTYTNLLNALHHAFNGAPHELPSAIGLMFSLNLQANRLLQTPVRRNSTETAGPSFQFSGN